MEISRHRGLPGGRAVLGGVLMAVAVVGVFLAYEQAGAGARATRSSWRRAPIRVGEVLEAVDLRTRRRRPARRRRRRFADVDALVGRVALGPIGEGEIVQAGSVTDESADARTCTRWRSRSPAARSRSAGSSRASGSTSSSPTTTARSSVVRGAQVVQIGAEDDGSLTSDREISLVVAVPTGDAVAAVVHALRTGDVTVVRSTFADAPATTRSSSRARRRPPPLDDEAG